MNEAFKLAPRDWALLRTLLGEALALPARERTAWLLALDDERSAGLKPRLRALLDNAADEESKPGTAARLLETLPKVETNQFAPPPGAAAEKAGDAVGPYRLVRELGSGGMGSVWLAERTDLLQGRQVALKLPHGAWKRAGLPERLAREREILATLEHPNIARLYDAGVTPEGQPWLALEVVQGERIDAFCRAHAVSLPKRLHLFLQVALAVAHAHGQLVVHRDLKPANILVTAAGEVKLLDFGIAKLMQEGVADETELTRDGGRAYTPEYASPEQILGRPIGTASDIYSLGVVLFELVADARPYRLQRSSRAALEEAITEADVPRPSSLSPASRRRALRGNLDTIVMKALARDPSARYPTVAALADDLQRHLDHRPLLAVPEGLLVRARKFVRRNRVAVGAGSLVGAALLAGLAATAWQARVARAEQQRAEAVKSFVAGLFTDADPFRTTSKSPTVESLLQTAQQRLAHVTGGGPAVRVELLLMIGSSFFGLEKFDRAEPLFAQAITEARRDLGADHDLTRRARLDMLKVHRFRGRRDEIKAELESLLPGLRRARTAAEREDLLAALTAGVHLAIDEGRYAQARDGAREVQTLAAQWYGELHPTTVDAALVHTSVGQFIGDAQATLDSAVRTRDLLIRVHGAGRPHAKVLDGRFMYGRALGNVGRFDEAVTELTEVLAQVRAMLGADASMAAFVAVDISRFLLELGDSESARAHAQAALAIVTRDAQENSYTVAAARMQLGRALLALYRSEEARAELERALAGIVASRGPDSPLALDVAALHAAALAQGRRLDEAWRALEPRLAAYRAAPTLVRFRGLHVAGRLRRLQGDLAAAQALQDEALAALPEQPLHLPRRNAVLGELARVAVERSDPTRALELLGRVVLPQGSASAGLAAAERDLTRGRALLGAGRAQEALAHLRRADAAWAAGAAGSAWASEAAYWLARALEANGEAAAARAAMQRVRPELRRSGIAAHRQPLHPSGPARP